MLSKNIWNVMSRIIEYVVDSSLWFLPLDLSLTTHRLYPSVVFGIVVRILSVSVKVTSRIVCQSDNSEGKANLLRHK